MKSKIASYLVALALPAFAANPNELSPAEKSEGFQLIFDGKTLDGWRNFKKEGPSEKTKVEDGAIVIENGSGDLITTNQYADFELRFQFQISRDGNSGVMWRVSENYNRAYETGPEFQILDSFGTKQYPAEVKRGNIAGALYDIIPGKPEWSKPAGEWNDATIKVVGTKITLTLNGTTTADVDTASEEFKPLFNKSKFVSWAAFNKEKKGHICLQEHGDRVAFRSIRIKAL
jgi:hypothetical protein